MRHTFSEALSGLRRNASMTLAVVVTMWVSLSLFGAGMLAARQVDLLKDRWYDKIEISVFLCVKDVKGDNCDTAQDATDAEKAAILSAIQQNPETQDVFYESKQQAFDEFKRVFVGSSIEDSLTVDQMQDSYRVKLKDPASYQGLVSEMSTTKGVQFVQDLHALSRPDLHLAQRAEVGDDRDERPAPAGGLVTDRQHHTYGRFCAKTRARNHAPGGREQHLHHAAVLAGESVRGSRRRGAGERDFGARPVRRGDPECSSVTQGFTLDRVV